jgi:hypothetical protein
MRLTISAAAHAYNQRAPRPAEGEELANKGVKATISPTPHEIIVNRFRQQVGSGGERARKYRGGQRSAATKRNPKQDTRSGVLQVVASTQASAGRRGGVGGWVPPNDLCKEITAKKLPTFRDEHCIQRRSGLPGCPTQSKRKIARTSLISLTY